MVWRILLLMTLGIFFEGTGRTEEIEHQEIDFESSEMVMAALTDLTGSADVAVRRRAIESFGAATQHYTVNPFRREIAVIIQIYKKEKDVTVRQAIVRIWTHLIHNLGGREIDEVIHLALIDPEVPVRQQALEAATRRPMKSALIRLTHMLARESVGSLRAAAASAIARIDDPQVTPILLKTLQEERDRDVRSTLAMKLWEIKNIQILGVLVDTFRQSDPFFKSKFLQMFKRNQGPEAMAILTMAVKDGASKVAIEGIQALMLHHARDAQTIPALIEALEHRDTKVKEIVVTHLHRCRDSRVTSALARFAKDPNPSVRSKVVMALGESQDDLHLSLWMEALKDRDPLVRAAAVGSFGGRSDPAIVAKFLKLWKEDNVDAVKEQVIRQFGKIKSPEVLFELNEAAKTGNHQMKFLALQALGQWGEDGVESLKRALKNEPEFNMRCHIINCLSATKSLLAIPVLAEMMSDQESGIRISAVSNLASFGNNSFSVLFKTLKDDPDPRVRITTAQVLASTKAPEALAAVRQTSRDDPDESVRTNATQALYAVDPRVEIGRVNQEEVPIDIEVAVVVPMIAGMFTPDQIPLLLKSSDQPGTQQHQMVIEVIRSIIKADEAGAVKMFIQCMEDPNPVVRFEIVGYLQECKKEDVQPILKKILNDLDPSVQSAAAVALSQRGQEVLSHLSKAFKHVDARSRVWAVWAMGQIGLQAEVIVPLLLEGYRDQDGEVREQSVLALGQMKVSSALKELLAALSKDRDFNVRRAAALALGALGDAKGAPGLRQALLDPEPRVQDAAQQALEQMGELELELLKKRPR